MAMHCYTAPIEPSADRPPPFYVLRQIGILEDTARSHTIHPKLERPPCLKPTVYIAHHAIGHIIPFSSPPSLMAACCLPHYRADGPR